MHVAGGTTARFSSASALAPSDLLTCHAPLQDTGATPLLVACACGSAEAAGADLEACPKVSGSVGRCPLGRALPQAEGHTFSRRAGMRPRGPSLDQGPGVF